MPYPLSKCRHPEDVKRIIRICAAHGFVVSPLEAQTAWEEYSNDLCAGWLYLPKDDEDVWVSLPQWLTGEEPRYDVE